MRRLALALLLVACDRTTEPLANDDTDTTSGADASDPPDSDPPDTDPPEDTVAADTDLPGDAWVGEASGSYYPISTGGGTTVSQFEFCTGPADLRRGDGLVSGTFTCVFPDYIGTCSGVLDAQPEAGPWSYALTCFETPPTDQSFELAVGVDGTGTAATSTASWSHEEQPYTVPITLTLP